MAAPVSLSFSLDPQNHHLHYHSRICTNTLFKLRQTRPFTPSRTGYNLPHSALHKAEPCSFKSLSSSCSQSSTMANSSYHDNPFQTSRFVSNYELQKLKLLENFRYFHELKSGSISIRVMREDEMDNTAGLLAESFTESMLWPSGYVSVLRFLVKQYLIERRTLMPHTATLIGFYIGMAGGGEEKEEELLAGTVEIFFDKRGANASLPTPTPPKDSPYICNMIVKEPLRRRGIGWHLLKASEELISLMTSSTDVYLHCRMIDSAPFNMYSKAGYKIVKTDSILILLTLQRRKHLMYKKLPVSSCPLESDTSDSDSDN